MQSQASLEDEQAACYLQQGLPTNEKADSSHPVEALHHNQQQSPVLL